MSSSANVSSSSACASACERPGAGLREIGDLPLAVQAIDRRRAGALVERDEVAQLHQLAAPGADGRRGDRLRRAAERVLRLEHDVVLIRRRVEGRHLLARDERVDGLRDVLDADAEVGRALPVDVEPQLGPARQVRPIDVDEDLALVEHLHAPCSVYSSSFCQIGPDERVLNHGAAAARRPGGRRIPARRSRADCRYGWISRRARATSSCWDTSRSSIGFSRMDMLPLLLWP